MPPINQQQAREFLGNISNKDKIAIIHHDDLDGFASGILFYDFCKKKGCEVKAFPVKLENSIFTKIIEKLKNYNTLLIADIAPFYVSKNLEQFKDKRVFYTDHHQKDTEVSSFILELRTKSEEYIPSSRTAYELTKKENKDKEWLGVAGTIADVGHKYPDNEKFIFDFLKRENISLKEYEQTVVYQIIDLLIYFANDLEQAFETLKNVESWKNLENIKKYYKIVEEEIQKVLKDFNSKSENLNGIHFYYFESKFKIKSVIATNLSLSNEDKTIITATPSNSQKGVIDISAKGPSRKYGMPELLKSSLKGLENASAGGHLRAAGGFLQAKDLEKFKENLKEFMKNNSKA